MEPKRFAVPSGSLMERTLEILQLVGFVLLSKIGRDDRIGFSNSWEFCLRDRENIAQLIASGKFGAGITGSDLRVNSGVTESEVRVVMDLPYARASNAPTRWVLAAPGEISKTDIRIGTERTGLAKYCLKDMLMAGAKLVELPGKEESAVADGLCDAVFVVTETGSSLAAHGLKIIRDDLFISTPQLLACPRLSAEKLAFVEELGLAMRAVLDAEFVVTVTFDLPTSAFAQLELPSSVSPTVSPTLSSEWSAGQVLIERARLGHVLRQLKLAGARGVFMQDVQAYMKGGK